MRILLIHRYFWPDTPPYAVILKKIAERLATDGHDVEVLSTQPTYKPKVGILRQAGVETIDGYKIRRLSLLPDIGGKSVVKVLNILLFGCMVMLHALKHRKYDIIMVSTTPPVLAGLSARIAAKISKAKFFYHCMDIHPESGQISGDFANKSLFRFLQKIDSKTCRQAERVIVLSEDMKKAILNRGGNETCKINIIQNFSLDDKADMPIEVSNEFKKKSDGIFRLIFAGNIGRFQGLDLLVDTFLELEDAENIELIFLGDGKMTNPLKKIVADAGVKNIRFIPHQSMTVANSIIKTADLGIVSLTPGVYQYAYPTKVIAYLSVGCPLLVIIEPESSLVSFVKQYKIGININPGDKLAFKKAIVQLNKDRTQLKMMKRNALVAFKEVYDESFVLDKWSLMMRNI